MHVTFSGIAASRALRGPDEAAGLVLAAMAVCEDAARRGEDVALPEPGNILLGPDGHASFAVRLAEDVTSSRVKAIASLLRHLLNLDSDSAADRAGVPGSLMLLIARATGQIDLPPPSYAAVRATLERFGSPDAGALSAVYRRIVTAGGVATTAVPPRTGPRLETFTPRRAALAASLAAAILVLFLAAGRDGQPTAPAAPQPVPDAVTVQTLDIPVTASHGAAPTRGAPVARPTNAARPEEAPARPLLPASLVGTHVFSPSFARDDRGLLFHSGRDRSALMLATFDGTGAPEVATVLRDGAANYHATLSPDGQWIAYDSDRDGTRGVYVARSDGSGARKISGDGYAAVPRWSPEGRRVTFVKAEAARPRVWNVWVADLAGGTLARVSRHRVGQAWGASWFPDGRRVAYSVEDRLIVANVEDGSARVLARPRPGRLVRTPAVSPDGRLIVFQVYRDGVWLLDVATGSTRRVMDDAAAEEFAWSPDGRRVVFHTRRNGAWSVWQLQLAPA